MQGAYCLSIRQLTCMTVAGFRRRGQRLEQGPELQGPCLLGWKSAIKTLKALWKDLSEKGLTVPSNALVAAVVNLEGHI